MIGCERRSCFTGANLYRAVDKQGHTVDSLLSERRDVAAAERFFSKALENHATPRVITLDAYAASHRAIQELKSAGTMPRRVRIRSSQYLNNTVEQDHRRVKQRIRPMLGFKRFETAAKTLSGIELAEKQSSSASCSESPHGPHHPVLFCPHHFSQRNQSGGTVHDALNRIHRICAHQTNGHRAPLASSHSLGSAACIVIIGA
jgi:hypothetical protein